MYEKERRRMATKACHGTHRRSESRRSSRRSERMFRLSSLLLLLLDLLLWWSPTCSLLLPHQLSTRIRQDPNNVAIRTCRENAKSSVVLETRIRTGPAGQERGGQRDASLSSQILETNLQLAELARKCEDPRAKLNHTDAALEAYRILRSMPGGHPDTVAYNSVLKVLSKISPARLPPISTVTASAEPVRFVSFTESEDSVAKSSQTAADWARELLEEMKAVHEQQSEANAEWYRQLKEPSTSSSALFQTVDVVDDGNENEDSSSRRSEVGPPRVFVKPNVRSYSTVMDAFARHATAESSDVCRGLLQELEMQFARTGDAAYRPNIIVYNTCLSALARSRKTQECWDLFLSMPVERDIISVNVLLHALARSAWSDAGERAESIMQNFTTTALDTSESAAAGAGKKRLVNNARTFSTCMDAWARCGRPDKARDLLEQLLVLHDASDDDRYRPNCVPFGTVIHAYSVSKDRNKTFHAFKVFELMKERKISPNSVVLNNLLNCFATRPHPETVEMVETLYRHILENHGGMMDQFTFGIVLKAVSTCRLLWKDKDFAPRVFRECCRRGFVSSVVLWQLRQAVPVDTYRELLGIVGEADHVDVDRIPEDWRRHVDERKAPLMHRRKRK